MTDEQKIDLAALQSELDKATADYKEARQKVDRAQNVATDACNRLNRAQKALDEAVDQLRKGAPRNSDWKSQRRNSSGPYGGYCDLPGRGY